MKWLVYAAAIWCFTKLSEEAATKCKAGSLEMQCLLNGSGLSLVKTVQPKSTPNRNQNSLDTDTPDDAECLPGSEWESHCHQCKCTDSGLAQCEPIRGCISKFPEPIRCKPNSTFGRDCNTCVCLHNGLGLCTLEPCHRSVKKKSDLPAGHDCAPHTFWKSRCNDCGCSPNGYAYCTEKACPGSSSEPIMTCAPDSMWKNECNTCFCTANGYPLCTRMGCTLNVNFEPARSVHHQPGAAESDSEVEVENDKKAVKALFSTFYTDDENNGEDLSDDGSDIEPTQAKVTNSKNIGGLAKPNQIEGYEYPHLKNTSYGFTNVKNYRMKPSQFKKIANPSKPNKLRDDFTDPPRYEQKMKVPKTRFESPHPVRKNTNKPLVGGDPNKFVDELFNYMMQETKTNINNEKGHKEDNEVVKFEDKGEVSDSDEDPLNSWDSTTKKKFKRSIVCKPNEMFQADCNTCKCSERGDSYSCTQNECMDRDMNKEVEVFMESEGVDHIERHSVCKPSGTFYIGCNTCHCNHDGTDYSCTNKPCPLPEDVELFHELREMKPIVPLKEDSNKKAKKTQTV